MYHILRRTAYHERTAAIVIYPTVRCSGSRLMYPRFAGDGLHGQQPVMQNPSLPWGPNEAAAAATFSGLLPTWGPSGNFLNMPNLSAMDPQVVSSQTTSHNSFCPFPLCKIFPDDTRSAGPRLYPVIASNSSYSCSRTQKEVSASLEEIPGRQSTAIPLSE